MTPMTEQVTGRIADGADDQIRASLEEAELPALLATLAHLTGDLSVLRDHLRPPLRPTVDAVEPQGGMSPEAQQEARELAFSVLTSLRDEEQGRLRVDSRDEFIAEVMEFMTGGAPHDYLPLLLHELGVPGDRGKPEWSKDELDPDSPFSVAVIGAGMSGLAAAYRLQQAGIDFVAFERNEDVGGTWFENSYPGCRLDTHNFAYSYSFAQRPDWPEQFTRQKSMLAYFRRVAEDLAVRDRIRFNTAVVSAVYDDDTCTWTVRTRRDDGREEAHQVNAIISAVGQLNQPSFPDVPGRDSFAGPSFHSARWQHDVDLGGRRVGVFGTGASAYQIVPSIADTVGHLTVFQRSAPWMVPTPTYHDPTRPGLRWLFEQVPYYHRWYRFWQFWTAVEGRRRFVVVDPQHDDPLSISADNAHLRELLLEHLARQYPGRPDLLEKVIPRYPVGAKRMLRDNGVWARTLQRDDVSLVTDRIERVEERGVVTEGGKLHELDVLIYATGFSAGDHLGTFQVIGRGGVDLRDWWGDDARAHLGITVPHFPNLFCIYGPNTNLSVNGSIVLFSECAVDYVLGCLRMLLETGGGALECRQEVHDAFNERVDAANSLMAWGVPGVSSWYKNRLGRVSQNWPFAIIDYWKATRAPDPEHFVLLRPRSSADTAAVDRVLTRDAT
jgi:4-hydroxyacetophenone monooxygenase